MKLYHGTNCNIEAIDLAKCRPYKDFGKGFYLTELKQQAQEWAFRISESFGNKPKIIEYEYTPNLNIGLNILKFEKPCIEWAYFIMSNRSRNLHEVSGKLDNRNCQYDIVEGPVGNDDIAVTLNQFIQGLIDDNLLLQRLEYKELNHQMSFHTEISLRTLTKTGEYDL
jgi:hypothetical protein